MNEHRIKDLCIALEVLSRISGGTSEDLSLRIQDLVKDLLKEEETRQTHKPAQIEDEIHF